MTRILAIALIVFAGLFPVSAHAGGATVSGQARVIDADTLQIGAVTVRLHGIDAMERNQLCINKARKFKPCGLLATAQMARLVFRRQVVCNQTGVGRYGRMIAKCSVDGKDLATELVLQGAAVAYRKYSLDYVAAEDVARTNDAGVWSMYFNMPWEWRRLQKEGS